MNKSVVVVVALVGVLAVAPWGVGKVVEKRLDQGVDTLVEVAPYLTVVERRYTPGWFKSEQELTLEAFSAWTEVLSPETVENPKNAAAGSDDGVPADEEKIRFTVRNEVLHGPILGFTGLGLARVETHLVLDEKRRKEIEALFGPESPLEVTTRVGFLGGGTTTLRSEGRTVTFADTQTEVAWDTARMSVGYSRDLDDYELDGKWPALEITDRSRNSHVAIADTTIEGDGTRVRGDLYDGDFKLAIGKLTFDGADQEKFEVNDARYVVNSESQGGFTSMSARMGFGEVQATALSAQGVEIRELHYDFTVRRLHSETLERLASAFKAMYARPLGSPAEVNDALLGPFRQHGMTLLSHDPEFVVDRIGIVTPEGDGHLKGVLKLQGATPQDFAAGSTALGGKIHADFTLDLSEKMVRKFPNGLAAAQGFVDAGLARRDGGRLVSRLVFTEGRLTVNGRPQAIPGPAGPPPQQ